MNKLTYILKYIIFIFGIATILTVLLSGCDKLGCYPTYDARNNVYGFACGGKF